MQHEVQWFEANLLLILPSGDKRTRIDKHTSLGMIGHGFSSPYVHFLVYICLRSSFSRTSYILLIAGVRAISAVAHFFDVIDTSYPVDD
ncbi:hypothetical protein SASPL_108087 [Salvia splendens]|uniref:Uncharacterized protein n=1 Tax=Salvia splendens TaxID=180675 RepID=A0A8X8YCG6_SALSN|nr:hypothetical protein SASPL_108087 [Salvia splendens]